MPYKNLKYNTTNLKSWTKCVLGEKNMGKQHHCPTFKLESFPCQISVSLNNSVQQFLSV